MPGHRRAPVMARDDRRRLAERVDQADDVTDEVKHRVLIDRLRPVGPSVPAHVGRHRAKARLGERGQLVAPRVPRLGKAVAKDDERAHARLGDVHLDAVGLDDGVLEFHAGLPCVLREHGFVVRATVRGLGSERSESKDIFAGSLLARGIPDGVSRRGRTG